MRRNVITESEESVRPSRPKRRLPQIFGRGGRDRALIPLAANRLMDVRELARAIGSDSSKTFAMVERLRESGPFAKRTSGLPESGRPQSATRMAILRPGGPAASRRPALPAKRIEERLQLREDQVSRLAWSASLSDLHRRLVRTN